MGPRFLLQGVENVEEIAARQDESMSDGDRCFWRDSFVKKRNFSSFTRWAHPIGGE